jgi:hypothetical protein
MQDVNGVTQRITNAMLATGPAQWFSVNWAPVNDGSRAEHWCVKVVITAPGEPNTDNKMVISNFLHVVLGKEAHVWRWHIGTLLTIPHGRRWRIAVSPHSASNGADRPRPCGGSSRTSERGGARVPVQIRAEKAELVRWDGKVHAQRPAPGVFYPVDERTLPPGVSSDNLVTVVQEVDGHVIGGVTFSIGPDQEPSTAGPRRRAAKRKKRSKAAASSRARSPKKARARRKQGGS